ncbi:MAG TPA: hypothetical protein ENJ09_08025 [Planctomycetes bacterium]|nr:hypothetical protein [Planctomycetota bacterium]
MPTPPPPPSLDDTVRSVCSALTDHDIPSPEVLLFLATGAETWAEHLADGHEVALGEIEGMPERWRSAVLYAGMREGVRLWAMDDLGADPSAEAGAPAWASAFPVWLAAAAGASILVHGSAGTSLEPATDREDASPIAPGTIVAVCDHMNLCGRSPLTGLGESRLGPLFPDMGRLHHLGLADAARARAEELGLPFTRAIAACTLGPALETPSEQRMLARLGADVAVQGLAAPLLAAAHAGLSTLALVCVAATARARADVQPLLERAEELAPALDRLILALLPDFSLAARALSPEDYT